MGFVRLGSQLSALLLCSFAPPLLSPLHLPELRGVKVGRRHLFCLRLCSLPPLPCIVADMRRSGHWLGPLSNSTATLLRRSSFNSPHRPTSLHTPRLPHPPTTHVHHLSSSPEATPSPAPPPPPPVLPPPAAASTSASPSPARQSRLAAVFSARPSSPSAHSWPTLHTSRPSAEQQRDRATDSQTCTTLRAGSISVRWW